MFFKKLLYLSGKEGERERERNNIVLEGYTTSVWFGPLHYKGKRTFGFIHNGKRKLFFLNYYLEKRIRSMQLNLIKNH